MEKFDQFVLTPVALMMNLICSVYLYRLSGLLLEYRNKLRLVQLIGYMFLMGLPIYNADAVNVLGLLGAFLAIVFISTKGGILNRLSAVLIFYPLFLGVNYLLNNNPLRMIVINYRISVYEGQLSLPPMDYLRYLGTVMFLNAVKILAWALLYYCFRSRLKEIRGYMTGKIWMIVAVVCTAAFISMVTVIIYPPADLESGGLTHNTGLFYQAWRTVVVVLSGMFSIIGILYLLGPMIENVKNREKLQIEGLKEEYYRSLEEQQESVRRIRHDMNNHFQAIKGCLEQGDIKGAGKYLEQFGASLPAGGGKQFCRDRALNAVLNSRWEKLQRLGTDVHFNLQIDPVMEITSLELCTIFSNALDNAIEAVGKIAEPGKRQVLLQARNKKGYFSLRVANSKENPVAMAGKKVVTDKSEAGHGYGIENMREIAERYGGNMEVEYTKGEFVLFLYLRLE